MNVGCRMDRNYRVEYFNIETGKTLAWKAKHTAFAYTPPWNHMRFPIPHTKVEAGEVMPYDNMKYGYQERDFDLIELGG